MPYTHTVYRVYLARTRNFNIPYLSISKPVNFKFPIGCPPRNRRGRPKPPRPTPLISTLPRMATLLVAHYVLDVVPHTTHAASHRHVPVAGRKRCAIIVFVRQHGDTGPWLSRGSFMGLPWVHSAGPWVTHAYRYLLLSHGWPMGLPWVHDATS